MLYLKKYSDILIYELLFLSVILNNLYSYTDRIHTHQRFCVHFVSLYFMHVRSLLAM